MEATPTFLDYTEIMEVFMQVDGVVRVHNLRLWSLSVNKNALSAHLAIGNYIMAMFFLLLCVSFLVRRLSLRQREVLPKLPT